MKWDYPAPHLSTHRVQETDIDGLGHTNNACYLRWCETAAWSHSATVGLALGDWQQLDRALAISHASYDYLAPSFAGDDLHIATWLRACDGKLRAQRCFQMIRGSDQTIIFRGSWQLTSIIISSGKPTRMPAVFRERYGALAGLSAT